MEDQAAILIILEVDLVCRSRVSGNVQSRCLKSLLKNGDHKKFRTFELEVAGIPEALGLDHVLEKNHFYLFN